MSKITKSYIVAVDYDESTDHCVLIVGEKKPGMDVAVVNSFAGSEAKDIWNSLAPSDGKLSQK